MQASSLLSCSLAVCKAGKGVQRHHYLYLFHSTIEIICLCIGKEVQCTFCEKYCITQYDNRHNQMTNAHQIEGSSVKAGCVDVPSPDQIDLVFVNK